MAINIFVVDGNLTDDAVERQSKDGKTFVTFRLAHNDFVKGEKVTDFYSCTSFSKYIVKCAPSLVRGVGVVVSGKLVHRQYQDKAGTQQTSYDLTVDGIKIQNRAQEQQEEQPEAQPELYDSDIPF